MEKKKKSEAAAVDEGGGGSTAGEVVEGGEHTEGDEEPQAPKTVGSNSSVTRECLKVSHNLDL